MFTHLNQDQQPEMVDISGKAATDRSATATARVVLGEAIMNALKKNDFTTKKGSIFQTAVIAGTMAVKQTANVIPLCHNIPIAGVKIEILVADASTVEIASTVKTTGPTGVEMEALHGATVAALTIYDMCKALSHGITIEEVKLLSKRGGKSDFG